MRYTRSARVGGPGLERALLSVAWRFWPALGTMEGRERTVGVGDVVGVLYGLPLLLGGLAWLAAATDPAVLRQAWPVLLLLFLLLFLFQRLAFYLFVEIRPGTFANFEGTLGAVVVWSAALIFGPTALWPLVLRQAIGFARHWRRAASPGLRWNLARNATLGIAEAAVSSLTALALYERWGGLFPLPGLRPDAALLALAATFIRFLLAALIWMPLVVYFATARPLALAESAAALRTFVGFLVMALGWPALVDPFAILAAGLYAQSGVGAYLFFILGLLLTSLLAHRLSQAVERSQQRSRELAKLEALGRAVTKAPPDASTLPDLLREHVPAMFPESRIAIRLFPDRTLLRYPRGEPPVADAAWTWLETADEARCFLPGAALPWDGRPAERALVVAPILDVERGEPIGGICLSPLREPKAAVGLLPAVQALAAQIASALHGAEVYARTLAHQRVAQELALAGRIQASFLPGALPEVPGWQVAAVLEPARETSGDFYDFIPLSDGRLGLLVADVADKGVGAALYMALSRTLLRTYAVEYATRPERVLAAANRRILADAQAGLFITVFYGVLDPPSGRLTYASAGHNPPYLVRAAGEAGRAVQTLRRTGIPLGILDEGTWERRTVHLAPGDLLVLYTDGVTEAQNAQGRFFGEERLLAVLQAHRERPAQAVCDALLTAVREFAGGAPPSDDITLVVVARQGARKEAET
ncbi:MAG TPA: hypothetical protein ENK56_07275 [Chloroflexi bacterium]|nr:hypothetical protein [Chloroflexota bacterium]